MELKEAIEARTSIRQYTRQPVPIADLREMVRLAGRAPSLNNTQPWRYFAITAPAKCQRVSELVCAKLDEILPRPNMDAQERATARLYDYVRLLGDAPALLIVASRTYPGFLDDALMATGFARDAADGLRGHPFAMSLGASIQNLLLAATDMGYGACWLTVPLVAASSVEREVGIEQPWKLGAVISIGKPHTTCTQAPKKPIEAIFAVVT